MPEQALQLNKLVSYLDKRRLDTEFSTFGYDYSEVSAELASRWKFPEVFSAAIRAFPKPLVHQPFNPMAGIIHLAVWIARANENDIKLEEIRVSCPSEVCEKFNLKPFIMLDEMPPLTELSSGLEDLVA
jgi:HD-like signal output (HDOD) protein